MSITVRDLDRRDYTQARHFAIRGMNLKWFVGGRLELYLYSTYFWSMALTRATRVLGAYEHDCLVGVLLVDMADQPKVRSSVLRRLFVSATDLVIRFFYDDSTVYEEVNAKMLGELRRRTKPDGELNFFAVHPERNGHGVGTLLLNELSRLEPGKLIYAFSDSASTYQFYERRGFVNLSSADILLSVGERTISLTCFLFCKVLPHIRAADGGARPGQAEEMSAPGVMR